MPTYTVETHLTARAVVREIEVSHPIYTVECALTRPAYVVETGLDLAPPTDPPHLLLEDGFDLLLEDGGLLLLE